MPWQAIINDGKHTPPRTQLDCCRRRNYIVSLDTLTLKQPEWSKSKLCQKKEQSLDL